MEKLLTKKQVREIVGFSFAHIDRMIVAGTFPLKVKVGFRVFWVESEIQEWITCRIAERDISV